MEEFVQKLTSKVGIDKETAEKVLQFLKENASQLPRWLGSEGGSVAEKLKGGLGGAFGGQRS
jgi:hypothetical protein